MAGGLNIVRVNYKGTGLALNGLLAGESQMMLIPPQTIGANVKSDKLKVLAITSAHRSPAFPTLPTMMEAGIPGYEANILQGVLAPAKTPPGVVNRLNQEMLRIIGRPDVREKFAKIDQDVYGSTPQQFAAIVKSEMAKWGKVIKDAGITAE
jgi:tripartite-type tricarboxylate transporter receptor subunit TctC